MIRFPGVLLLIIGLAACSTVPLTGRRQLDLVPSNQIMAISADQYRKFMAEHEVITGTADLEIRAGSHEILHSQLNFGLKSGLFGMGPAASSIRLDSPRQVFS
jgi:hypothetical protein